METKWIRECINRLDSEDKFNVGVAEGAMKELAAIEKGLEQKDVALRMALSYLPARDGKRIQGDPDSDAQLAICNAIKAALSTAG